MPLTTGFACKRDYTKEHQEQDAAKTAVPVKVAKQERVLHGTFESRSDLAQKFNQTHGEDGRFSSGGGVSKHDAKEHARMAGVHTAAAEKAHEQGNENLAKEHESASQLHSLAADAQQAHQGIYHQKANSATTKLIDKDDTVRGLIAAAYKTTKAPAKPDKNFSGNRKLSPEEVEAYNERGRSLGWPQSSMLPVPTKKSDRPLGSLVSRSSFRGNPTPTRPQEAPQETYADTMGAGQGRGRSISPEMDPVSIRNSMGTH